MSTSVRNGEVRTRTCEEGALEGEGRGNGMGAGEALCITEGTEAAVVAKEAVVTEAIDASSSVEANMWLTWS